MISVFRIYLGQAWIASARASELVALFDAQPELLYSVSQLPATEATDPALSPESRRAIARIAMTQSHLVVLPADVPEAGDMWTDIEIQVARTGLRQRLPIVAVRHPDSIADGAVVRAADLVAPWNASDLACGIQQVVEAAAVERRKRLRRAEERAAAHAPAHYADSNEAEAAVRPLPTAKILDAYSTLKERRGLPPGTGSI
jgi:hypothetical protein